MGEIRNIALYFGTHTGRRARRLSRQCKGVCCQEAEWIEFCQQEASVKMQPWNSLVRLVFPLLFVFMEACSAAPLATAADAAHPSTNLPGQTDEPFVEIWVDPSHGDDNAGALPICPPGP